MNDFPFHIIPWWLWIIMACVFLGILVAFVYFVRSTEPGDYILVGYFAALVLAIFCVGATVHYFIQDYPEMQKYLQEQHEKEAYERRLYLAQIEVAKEDAAARNLRIKEKMKEL